MDNLFEAIGLDLENMLKEGYSLKDIQDNFDNQLLIARDKVQKEAEAKKKAEAAKIQKKEDADNLAAGIEDFIHTHSPELGKRVNSVSADDVLKVFDELDRSLNLVFKFNWDGFSDPIDKFLKKHNLS